MANDMIHAHPFIPSASDAARCQTCGESKMVWEHYGFGPNEPLGDLPLKPQDTSQGRVLANKAIDEIIGVPPPQKKRRLWLFAIKYMAIGSAVYWIAEYLWRCIK